jgi:hypothetical protein
MTLVFAGASNVLNAGLAVGQLGFSEQVSEKFNLPLHKIAVAGASNDFLFRSIYKHLEGNTPTLLIVTWQSWERAEWLHNGNYYQINNSGIDHLPVELHEHYKQFIIDQPTDPKYLGKIWHNRIWQLHNNLTQQGIQHIFYNEMYPFVETYPEDWGNNFIGPYTNELSYHWYLQTHGFTADTCYHYGLDGHTAWAELLINHINQYKLL